MISFILLFLRYTLGNLFIAPFTLLSPKLRGRMAFEKSYGVVNREDISSDIWFHASSEGEWEQIWPIVMYFFRETSSDLTIWFTSPSLKNKVDKLRSDCDLSARINAFPVSLLVMNPWSKRSILSYKSPKLFFMVRYDFFPELMWKGLAAEHFILLSATMKNKAERIKRNFVKKMVTKNRFGYFDHIVTATHHDAENFKTLFKSFISDDLIASAPQIDTYDFRNFQIIDRQKNLPNIQASHFEDSIEQLLAGYPFERRVVLGNFWSHEIDLFDEKFLKAIKDKKFLVFIAPHNLKGDDFDRIKSWFDKQDDNGLVTALWDEIGIHGKGNLILCTLPGLLCELYCYFGQCYIGNGFGRSIHSALEPFWGGGNLYCGPKVFRSTEYDFVREYYIDNEGIDMPFIIEELHDFYDRLGQNIDIPARKEKLEILGREIVNKKDKLLQHYQQLLASDQG